MCHRFFFTTSLLRAFALTALLWAAGSLALAGSPAVDLPRTTQIQQASIYCANGENAMKAGNIKRARDSFNKALEIVPVFPPAHMGLGHIALSERRYEEALREYLLAKDQYADLARTLLEIRARDYGNVKAEITVLTDELRKERKFSAPALRLSRIEAAIDRLNRMEEPQRSVSEEPPAYMDFYIGNACFHLNRLDDVIAAWQACIASDHDFAPAYQNLVVGFWLSGKKDEARDTASRAKDLGISLDPSLKADLEKGVDFGAPMPRAD